MPPITEGSIPSGSVRFKLNGLTKTINFPVSGAALHLLAGNPATLESGDVAVPNTQAPFTLVQNQELVSTHTLGGTKPAVDSLPVDHSPAPDKTTLVADTTTFHRL